MPGIVLSVFMLTISVNFKNSEYLIIKEAKA